MNNLEAVILAGGRGQNLYPLTKENNKHMLPICGKPLIAYSLEKCLNHNFRHITIVVNESNETRIRHYVQHKFKHPKLKKADIHCYVADSTHCLTEVLSEMITKYIIKTDFLMLYGDAISSYSLSDLIDNHYLNGSDITCGFLDTSIKVSELQKAKVKQITNNTSELLAIFTNDGDHSSLQPLDPPTKKKGGKKNMIKAAQLGPNSTLTQQRGKMLKVISKEKLEFKGCLNFKANLIDQSQNFEIRQDLSLANVYLISRQMFPILVHLSPKFSSFSEEMIGFLIDYQKNPKLLQYYGTAGAQRIVRERSGKPINPNKIMYSLEESTQNQILKSPTDSQNSGNQSEITPFNPSNKKPQSPEIKIFRQPSMPPHDSPTNQTSNTSSQQNFLTIKKRSMSSIIQDVSNVFYTVNRLDEPQVESQSEYVSIWETTSPSQSSLRIGMHVFQDFYKRVNSMEDFRSINLEALKIESILTELQRNKNSMNYLPTDHTHAKTMGLRNCFISTQTHFKSDSPSKISNSFLCEQVKIGNNCKIDNCILLKNVEIGDNCVLKNVCIGQDSMIREDCKLTNAYFGEKNLVKKGMKLENDVFNMTYNPNEMELKVDVIEATPRSRKHSQAINSP